MDKTLQKLGLNAVDIEAWQGKIFVVKAGGDVLDNANTLKEDVNTLAACGAKVVLVYGGQNKISEAMRTKGYKPRFTSDGLRVTDEAAMEIFLDVVPKIGHELVEGFKNVALVLPSVYAIKKPHCTELGYVGEPVKLLERAKELMDTKKIKVVLLPPLGKAYLKEEGYLGLWNSNADAVAGVACVDLHPEELLFLTNVDGIKVDEQVEHYMSIKEAREVLDKGYVTGGMQQKVSYALLPLQEDAINHVHILNGLQPHAILNALAHKPFYGTVIYR